jgi:tyrosyl-tRNA synthetase
MFGKTMSVADEIMLKYYTLLTDENAEQVKAMHPKEAKVKLAKLIIAQYYGTSFADEAAAEFDRVFGAAKKEIPKDAPLFKLSGEKLFVEVMVESALCKSKNEARRLIEQGAVEFESARITDFNAKVSAAGVLKVGSRRFLRIVKG